MSAQESAQSAASAHTPERQSEDVIEAAREARDDARAARDDAEAEFASIAHMIARSAIKGYDWPAEWADEYHAAEQARDAARDALHAARVEWYHSMGRHAHGYRPDLCCGYPEGSTPPGQTGGAA